jgi:hypothetical protein
MVDKADSSTKPYKLIITILVVLLLVSFSILIYQIAIFHRDYDIDGWNVFELEYEGLSSNKTNHIIKVNKVDSDLIGDGALSYLNNISNIQCGFLTLNKTAQIANPNEQDVIADDEFHLLVDELPTTPSIDHVSFNDNDHNRKISPGDYFYIGREVLNLTKGTSDLDPNNQPYYVFLLKATWETRPHNATLGAMGITK